MPKKLKKRRTAPKIGFDIKKAKIVITGGSGSLGKKLIKGLLERGAKNIVSLSRNEYFIKQAEIEIDSPFVKFKIGDITDKELMSAILHDTDVVFNAAALKHVSLAEENPREAYRVNVEGLRNVLDASKSVQRFVHISSDKAIGVINYYGATKLFGEHLVKKANHLAPMRSYILVRCPNFFGSGGSVLNLWSWQLKKNNVIRVSDPEMTRYFITLANAAEFILDITLAEKPNVKETHYPLEHTKKFRLGDLAEAFLKVHGNTDSKMKIVGGLSVEKKHEDYIADFPLSPVSELVSLIKHL